MLPRALIFDFFGVICSNTAPQWFENHFPQSETRSLKDQYFLDADLGKKSETELINQLAKISNTLPENVEQELESYAVLNQELIEIIRELKKNYKIGLCTNAVSGYFRKILAKNNIDDLFDAIVVSSEIGHSKPDQEMYISILQSLNIAANEAIFIDDTLKNIQEGEKLGIRGVLFISNEDLKKQLSDLIKN